MPSIKAAADSGYDSEEVSDCRTKLDELTQRKVLRLQNQIDALLAGKRELSAEIDRLREEVRGERKRSDDLLRKANQYDAIQFNLYRIHQKAESDAFLIRETAKESAMDSIFVIDDLKETVAFFERDAQALKADLQIGTVTAEDRISDFIFGMQEYIHQLNEIRNRFFLENHLPLE